MKRIDEIIAKRLKEACGDRVNISPVIAKDNVKVPFVIYACESFEAVRSKTGLEGFWSVYIVDIYTDTNEEGSGYVDKVISSLDGFKNDLVEECTIDSGSVDYTTCYVQTLKFTIAHG